MGVRRDLRSDVPPSSHEGNAEDQKHRVQPGHSGDALDQARPLGVLPGRRG